MPQYQGVWTLPVAARLQSNQQWATDPLYRNTTLLLQADNAANGAQNNTFLDSSSNNFTITRNGNTTQGTFTPYSLQPGAWSNYFDGSGDYLNVAANAAFQFGSGDFTIECWLYLPAAPTAYDVITCVWDGGNTTNDAWYFGLSSSYNIIGGICVGTTATLITSAGSVTSSAWNHVAFVRSGNSLFLFINGTKDSNTGSVSGAINNGTYPLRIGQTAVSTSFDINAYISNLRVLKGTAQYTANFTPPTSPLTAITNTSLLTCQSNRFIDNSTNAFAITRNGDVSVQAFSPFAPQYQYTPSVTGGSGYFDGTGDCLTSSFGTAIGTGDFTMEAWIYPNTTIIGYTDIFTLSGSNSFLLKDMNLRFYGITNLLESGSVVPRAWSHVAVARSGSTIRLFLNGTQTASVSSTDNITGTSLIVGAWTDAASEFWNGYISSGRILVGTALYTASFTPPTAPLTAITNTRLLLNFTNAGIYDGTLKNNLETVGNAQVSTSVVKYGTGSMYFDGSGDTLLAPFSPNFQLGTGDFTIECWINASASGSYNQIVGTLVSGTEVGTWRIGNRYNNTNAMYFARGNGASFDETVYSNVNVNDGLWHHIACVRLNGVIYMYVDGVARTVTSGSASIAGTCSSSNPLYVGYNGRDNSFITGYIDDLRVTKFARYTANFTPPTVALPRQ